MLSLSRMKAFFATAPPPEWNSPIAAEILTLWEHDPGTQGGATASSNIVCGFWAKGKRRILRFAIAEPSVFDRHSIPAIEAELAFLRWLGEKGFPAAQPVPSLAGRWVERVSTPIGTAHACVFEAIRGETGGYEDLPPERIPDWGRAIAAYHHAAQGYREPGRPGWQYHLEKVAAALPEEDGLAQATLDKLRRELNCLPVTGENFGLVHFDLCPDNLIWTGNGIAYIDFDDATYDWFAADLAYALPDGYKDTLLQELLAGYRSFRPLSDAEASWIPLFRIENHLIKYTEISFLVKEGQEPGEPEWTQTLRRKLAGMIKSYRAEFAAWLS